MSLRTQSSLDVNEDDLQQISSESTKLVFAYLTTISERPVRAENHAGKTLAAIDTDLSSDGRSIEQLIGECRTVMDLSRHNGHPRFFGYVASPSTPVGAYADLIASALNSNITCWRSGPAGTARVLCSDGNGTPVFNSRRIPLNSAFECTAVRVRE